MRIPNACRIDPIRRLSDGLRPLASYDAQSPPDKRANIKQRVIGSIGSLYVLVVHCALTPPALMVCCQGSPPDLFESRGSIPQPVPPTPFDSA